MIECRQCNKLKEEKEFKKIKTKRKIKSIYIYKYKKCNECISKERIILEDNYYSDSWIKRKRSDISARSKRRKKDHFSLTFEDIKLIFKTHKCYYCGISLKELKNKDITVDRKNNSIGYTLSNCVASCYGCNNLKRNYFDSDCKFKSSISLLEERIKKYTLTLEKILLINKKL